MRRTRVRLKDSEASPPTTPTKKDCLGGQKRTVVLKHSFPWKTAPQNIGKGHEEVTLGQRVYDCCDPTAFFPLIVSSLALVKEMPMNTSKI